MRVRPRVQQLRRTELARRVGSAQCLRSPHEVTYFAGPHEENVKGNYEKDSVISIRSDVHLRERIACLRIHSSSFRRNPPFRAHRLW